MPNRAARICPRCLAPTTTLRCSTCERRRLDTLALRGEAALAVTPRDVNPYKTPQWVAFSRAFRRAHPTCECERCLKLPEYRRPASQVVDHRDGLGPNGPRGFDPSNCAAMTISHHASKTNRHDGGLGRKIDRLDSTRAVEQRRVVLLLGPPGAGKSTTARGLALTLYDYDEYRRVDAFTRALARLGDSDAARAVVIRVGATRAQRTLVRRLTRPTEQWYCDAADDELVRRIIARDGSISAYQQRGIAAWRAALDDVRSEGVQQWSTEGTLTGRAG